MLNAAAPNGAFEVSNGESTTVLLSSAMIVERFDNARADGFVGGFDAAIRDRLQGGAVQRRVRSTIDPQGIAFSLPIETPLNHFGARAQLCFRAVDVGATGDAELLTAIRWRLFGSTLVADRFDQRQHQRGV